MFNNVNEIINYFPNELLKSNAKYNVKIVLYVNILRLFVIDYPA
jgi:hypothetical protein